MDDASKAKARAQAQETANFIVRFVRDNPKTSMVAAGVLWAITVVLMWG